MERRLTPRLALPVHQRPPAQLTLLSSDGLTDVAMPALLVDWSDAGLRLLVPQDVALGTPVRVELPDRLALGHACHCQCQNNGAFAVGVRVSQVLENLSALRRLAVRLMGASREERVPVSHL